MKREISDFFEPIQATKYIGSNNYIKIESYLKSLQAISKLCELSYYIIDYYKKSFYYVSPNPLFLSGYTREEVLKLGYDFYGLCVPDDDLVLLFNLNIAGFNFFYSLQKERRENAIISYDFRLKHKTNQSLIMINHKLGPLLLTDDGNIWMAICVVTLSSRKEPGDVHIVLHDDQSRFNFNVEKNTFEAAKDESLTKKEMEVLICTALGDSNEAISKKLKISESTLKNHKTKIFKKLHVSNTAEAVFYASKQNLI